MSIESDTELVKFIKEIQQNMHKAMIFCSGVDLPYQPDGLKELLKAVINDLKARGLMSAELYKWTDFEYPEDRAELPRYILGILKQFGEIVK